MGRPELLPCPFCGGEHISATWLNDGKEGAEVYCKQCRGAMWSGTVESAMELWNRRKPGPVTEALVTAFASACPSYLSDCSEVQLTLKAEDIRRFMAEVFVEGGEDA